VTLDELKTFFLVVGVSYRRCIPEIDDMTEATAEVLALIAEADRLAAENAELHRVLGVAKEQMELALSARYVRPAVPGAGGNT
jgi:hypothetical protein